VVRGNIPAADQRLQPLGGSLVAAPGSAPGLRAALAELGCVDPVETDPDRSDDQPVTVDDFGVADDRIRRGVRRHGGQTTEDKENGPYHDAASASSSSKNQPYPWRASISSAIASSRRRSTGLRLARGRAGRVRTRRTRQARR
jgi:hypothetical protein